jgi:PGF-pre-PGF domain-containing protein
LKGGEPATFSFEKMDVRSIVLKTKNDVSGAYIEVQKLDKGTIPKTQIRVYSLLNITSNINKGDIEKAEISFSVEKLWIAENKVQTVQLYKLGDKGWTPLQTVKNTEDVEFSYYTAETSAFSLYAIAGETGRETDYFWVWIFTAGFLVILLVIYLIRKFRAQNKSNLGLPKYDSPKLTNVVIKL